MRQMIKNLKENVRHVIGSPSPLTKAAYAEKALEDAAACIEELNSQITLLRSRLDAIQHGKGAQNVEVASPALGNTNI